jgi:hypothetical protein
MSDSPRERSRARQRAPIRLADAPLADYRPTPTPEPEPQSPPAEVARPSRGAGRGGVRRAGAGTPRAADPRTEPTPLAREATRSVNFHIPGSLDRALGRLKYELEAEYGVRTSKTALTAAALYALPREPLAALAWLRAYEAAVLPLDEGGAGAAEES